MLTSAQRLLSPSHKMSHVYTAGQHVSVVVNLDRVTSVALILSGREPEVDLVVLLDVALEIWWQRMQYLRSHQTHAASYRSKVSKHKTVHKDDAVGNRKIRGRTEGKKVERKLCRNFISCLGNAERKA